jgi:hypothetical protein
MGTQFRVKSNALDHPNGSHVVHLIEMDDNNDETLASAMKEIHVDTKSSNQNNSGKQFFQLLFA